MSRTALPLMVFLMLSTVCLGQPPAQPEQQPSDILELDIEQLGRVDVVVPSLDVQVTTVSRSESTVGQSAAAVFVITNEMIRRSGAREIPEVLRMAPGVNVSRITGNKWAVSIRGFNSRFSNKLLVQIDGRSVYTPLFAGVYWDSQNVLLEDVDRIEIIRGPGATVWGENAVNGIINIITKKSSDTQGGFFEAGAGTEWQGFSGARIGGEITDALHYRIYGQWFERDSAPTAPGFGPLGPADDDWRMGQGGFRMDWEPDDSNLITLQGDYYDGFSSQRLLSFLAVPPFVVNGDTGETIRGANLLYRWTHIIDDESDWSVQLYYDRFERRVVDNTIVLGEDRDTIDVDIQRRFPVGRYHEIISGVGYRFTEDFIRNVPGTAPPDNAPPFGVSIVPNQRALDTFSYFIQDQVNLLDEYLYLTIGSKFSHNDFTGFEMQPSIRLLLTPDERRTIWASVSRAVRTPSRADRGLAIDTPFFSIIGSPAFEAEEVLAYELGMRGQPVDEFYWDLALFYNDYTDLSTTAGVPPAFQLVNSSTHEQTWGFELANTTQLLDNWQMRAAYSFFRGTDGVAGTPRNQLYLQSSMDLGSSIYFDLIGRYADNISGGDFATIAGPTSVPAYFEMDARLAWRPTDGFEWFVVGRNLLDKSHNEALADPSGSIGSEVPREVYTGVTLRY